MKGTQNVGGAGKRKQNICLQIESLCLLSLTRVYLIIKGDWVWVRCQWPLCSTPSKVFDKSHELASHVLAIRLYCSQLEASFYSHLLPLIRPLFLVVYLVLVRFLGPHLYWANILTEFILVLFVPIKAAMDLLSIAILPQIKCVYFYCPVNRAQARAAFMGFVLGGERKT